MCTWLNGQQWVTAKNIAYEQQKKAKLQLQQQQQQQVLLQLLRQQQRLRLRLAPQSNNNNNSIKLSACSSMEIYEWQQITTTTIATTGRWSRQFEIGRGRGGVRGLHDATSFKTLQSQMFWFEWFADSQESFLSLSLFLCLSGACAVRLSQT